MPRPPIAPQRRHAHVSPVKPAAAVGAAAFGAAAFGAVAFGAFAIGALAVGQLAIGRLAVRRTRLGCVEIDDLVVRRLRVLDRAEPK